MGCGRLPPNGPAAGQFHSGRYPALVYTEFSQTKLIASTFTAGLVDTGWPVLQPRTEQAIARVIILRQPPRDVKWWSAQEVPPRAGGLAPIATCQTVESAESA